MERTSLRVAGVAGTVTLVGGVLLVNGEPVAAATFTVTNLDDSGPGSLRQAILDANAAPGADVITFDPALTGSIVLTTGQLAITDSVSINGPGAAVLTVSGNDASRVFYLYNSASLLDVTISGVTVADGAAPVGGGILNRDEELVVDSVVLTGNAAAADGGALWSDGFQGGFTMRDSVVTGNTAGDDGGGIYSEDTGLPLLIERTVISTNSAGGNGGGIAMYDPDTPVTISETTISGNTAAGNGGGLYLYDTDGPSPFTIVGSTISGNQAANGGGIALDGPDSPFTVRQSTISGNTATAVGGGLSAANGAFVAFEHSTVAGNTAGTAGGGVRVANGSIASTHTIIGDNSAPASPDAAGTVAADFSLIEDVGGATITGANNVTGQAPALGPLADNGGSTRTHRLGRTSPAIDAGDPAIVTTLTADQRGAARIVGAVIDIGATEFDAGTVAIDPDTITVAENGGSVTVTVTRSGTGDGAASVDVATSNDTAGSPGDFTALGTTVSWLDGEVGPKTVSVAVIADAVDPEPAETFRVGLSNPVGVAIADATASVTVTITNVATTTVPPTTQAPTTVAPATNQAPVISGIAGPTMQFRTSTNLPFTVTDPDDGDTLTVSVTSDRPDLFTTLDVVPGGSRIERLVGSYNVRIAVGSTAGTAQVTVTATDGVNTVTRVFQVNVVARLLPPTGASPSSGPIATVAAGFLALGAAATRLARRRR